MKKIDEKPMDCKVRDTVLRILERAMHYNNTKTKKEETGDKPTFFVEFSGHTAQLDVGIEVNGYDSETDFKHRNIINYTVYLTENEYGLTSDKIQNQLVAILKRMEEVYSAWYEKEHKDE